MKPIQKLLKLDRDTYFETHLAIVNAILPPNVKRLTPKEIQVLAGFMALEGDIATQRFGTSARRIVKEKLTLSDGGLGNYMKSLKDKGFITSDERGNLIIYPALHPESEEQEYRLKLINLEHIPDGN